MVGEKGGDKAEANKLFEKLLEKGFYSEAKDGIFKFIPKRIIHMVEGSARPLGHFDDIMQHFNLKSYDELINLMEEAIQKGIFIKSGDMPGYEVYQFIKDGKTLNIVLDVIKKTIITIHPG